MPKLAPGGYIGVDAFFVISGYLITTSLVARPPRTIMDLGRFWNRRIRRLLPAAFAAIIVTFLAAALLAPVTRLATTAKDAVYSAFYLQNWNLARQAVDYLQSTQPPGPMQHFWSLSVEEQFYIFWPVLVLLVALITRRRHRHTIIGLTAVFALVGGLSLAYSGYLTAIAPAKAYFITPTRVWELAIGGLLAVALPPFLRHCRPANKLLSARPGQLAVAWTGVAMIAAAGWFFSDTTAFPGLAALLPTLGSAVFIAGGALATPGRPARLPVRWLVFLGDASYSVYLWHWPVAVILPEVLGHSLTWWETVAAIAFTLVVSALSYKYIETPFRHTPVLVAPLRRAFAFALSGMMIIAVAGVGCRYVLSNRAQSDLAEVRALAAEDSCLGAAALLIPECSSPDAGGRSLVETPLAAQEDFPATDADGSQACYWRTDKIGEPKCHYGVESADATKVALLGNSHAAQWLPAVEGLASADNLAITTYIAAQCYPATLPLAQFSPDNRRRCLEYTSHSLEAIADANTDVVIMSAYSTPTNPSLRFADVPVEEQFDTIAQSWSTILQSYRALDIPVVVIRDTPSPDSDVPACLTNHATDPEACNGNRADWLKDDPLAAAALALNDPGVVVADLTDAFCEGETCFAVAGGLVVYRDHDHVAGTYAASAAEALAPYIDQALAQAAAG
jgi:peptidoglycan/LPS O-acetylase OafA/YrhL